jgi:hypothetical protein
MRNGLKSRVAWGFSSKGATRTCRQPRREPVTEVGPSTGLRSPYRTRTCRHAKSRESPCPRQALALYPFVSATAASLSSGSMAGVRGERERRRGTNQNEVIELQMHGRNKRAYQLALTPFHPAKQQVVSLAKRHAPSANAMDPSHNVARGRSRWMRSRNGSVIDRSLCKIGREVNTFGVTVIDRA